MDVETRPPADVTCRAEFWIQHADAIRARHRVTAVTLTNAMGIRAAFRHENRFAELLEISFDGCRWMNAWWDHDMPEDEQRELFLGWLIRFYPGISFRFSPRAAVVPFANWRGLPIVRMPDGLWVYRPQAA